MSEDPVSLGDVASDLYAEEGIVWGKAPRPPQKWIDALRHADEVKPLGEVDWWSLLLFGGGVVLVPAPLLTVLRRASFEDFCEAAETTDERGRDQLKAVFPEYVRRYHDMLREQRRDDDD